MLRPLRPDDFPEWSDVRIRSHDWLTKWEPMSLAGQPDIAREPDVFTSRCGVRDREWQLGNGFGFGIFVDGRFAGEINISSVQRGPFQSAYVGYWIDRQRAGNGYMPEAMVLVFKFAFEDIGLHRLQVNVIPSNGPSNRVAQKLELRNEGIAERYFEINGIWEDHVRYAITTEEWEQRRDELTKKWLR